MNKAFSILGMILLVIYTLHPVFGGNMYDYGNSETGEIPKNSGRQSFFVENKGQIDEKVKYYAKLFSGYVFITKTGNIVYSIQGSTKLTNNYVRTLEDNKWSHIFDIRCMVYNSAYNEKSPKCSVLCALCTINDTRVQTDSLDNCDATWMVFKEELVGTKSVELRGLDNPVSKISYFKTDDISRWHANIQAHEFITFGEVYQGIELKMRTCDNNVEKLFYIAPFTSPSSIQIKLSGIHSLRIDSTGQLVGETENGVIKFTKPVAYQIVQGKRIDVACSYKIICHELLTGGESIQSMANNCTEQLPAYGFAVGSYNKEQELIIDPLLGSTYLSGSNNDYINCITTDSKGNVYVVGHTQSLDFPTTGGYDISHNDDGSDIFISKFNSDLTSLIASTYFGGAGNDYGYSIAVDSSDNIYIAGHTSSTDIPTSVNTYSNASKGFFDIFVSKFNSDLTSLLASTYLGGSSYDYGCALSIDTNGKIYVMGRTWSSDFPTTSGVYSPSHNGLYDVFISKFDENLTSLIASTYLGGSDSDSGRSMSVNSEGNIYVCGYTSSSDFPATAGAYHTSWNDSDDVFVSKLNGDLTELLASTHFGGTDNDYGWSLAIDPDGMVYVGGSTSSSDYPTTSGAYKTTRQGNDDIFVSKLDGNLKELLASTYLGGSDDDNCRGIAVDKEKEIYISGYSASSDFPTTKGAYKNSKQGNYDVIVSKLSENLTELLASTYLGGTDDDVCKSMAVDGKVYIGGYTKSSDYPTNPDAYMNVAHGSKEAFLSKAGGNLSSLPQVTTGAVSNVTTHSAILNGIVNAQGTSTTAIFQYDSTSMLYGKTSSSQAIFGDADSNISISIDGLSSGATYYYRLVAQNEEGTVNGNEKSFTTAISTDSDDPPFREVLSIQATTPQQGAANVPVNSHVYALFSMLINGSTFTPDTFKLKADNGYVQGGVTTNNSTAQFIPSKNLSFDTTYTAVITTAAQAANYAGTSLNADYTWSFTTSSSQDASPPSGSILINSDSGYTNSRIATLHLAATDDGAVVGYYLSNDSTRPSDNSPDWEYTISSDSNFKKDVSYTLSGDDGNKTVYVWYKDSSGNISDYASDSIILDITKPKVTITRPTANAVYTTAVDAISLGGTASDATSGVQNVMWSDNNGGTGTANGTDNWFVSFVNVSGNNTVITITATDKAGNSENATITVVYKPIPVSSQTPTPDITPTPQASPIQNNKGTIYGTVVNKNGKTIKSVKIRLKGKNTKVKKTVIFGSESVFEFNDLESDVYQLDAWKNGYKRYKKKVSIEGAETKEITIKLKGIQ